MKDNKVLICLSFPSWEGNYTKSTVELMKEYSHYQRVIFIDYPFTWLDVFKNKNTPVKRMLSGKKQIVEEFPNISVYSLPPVIPFQRIRSNVLLQLILFINTLLINIRIGRIRYQENVHTANWLCALNPILGNRLKKIYKKESFYYYCYDEITAMNWVNPINKEEEIKYIKNSTAVFCTSPKLKEKCNQWNNNVYLVENGVNIDIFHINNSNKFNRKIVGYIGSIDDRLDLKLLEKLILKNPSYQFQFIGRVMDICIKQSLEVYKNVQFIPAMDPLLLVNYVKNFSIGIIPFVRNEFTENIFPMKVNEYLAVGKPVISTNFSDLSSLSDIIKIVNDVEEFQVQLISEIQNDNEAKKEQRIEHAMNQSWSKKADKLYSVISNQ